MRVTVIKIMLMAQDMERAMAFYRTVFGFDPKFTSEHWSEMLWKDAVVALHGEHDGSQNRTCFSIEVDDIVTAAESVTHNGGKILVKPLRREGEPIIYSEFMDTEGNIVMLTQFLGEDEIAAADLLA
jgi:predicted enzyme related to lactoylglutathione lyase